MGYTCMQKIVFMSFKVILSAKHFFDFLHNLVD